MYNNTNEIHLQHHTLFVEERLICQFLYKSIQIIVVLKKTQTYLSTCLPNFLKNQKIKNQTNHLARKSKAKSINRLKNYIQIDKLLLR